MLKNKETFEEFEYYPNSLKKYSNKYVICECDYCHIVYKIKKSSRSTAHKKLDKDACKKCRFKKREEIELRDYGCTNPFARKEVKNKIKNNNIQKYGVESYTQTEEFKEKSKKTNLERYGVENVFKSEEIQDKIKQTQIKNGSIKIYNDKTMLEWAKKLEKPYSTFKMHVGKYGFEEAIKIPVCCSELESVIKIWLDEKNIQYKQHVRIEDKYCDFLIDNLVLELDGLYWHCDRVNIDNNYHVNKKNMYNKLGYKSLFFRENEINDQFDIVKSMIKNQLGLGERVFARKCKFEEIKKDIAKEFFINNHLMGKGVGVPYALTYNDKPISIMQIKRVKGQNYEISRFCTVINTNIVGGFSKLLKNVEKVLDMDSLNTFIDCRYGVGDYLKEFGFEKETCYKSFKWVNGLSVENRMKFPGNSGYENGYAKIWDCGQIKYNKIYKK